MNKIMSPEDWYKERKKPFKVTSDMKEDAEELELSEKERSGDAVSEDRVIKKNENAKILEEDHSQYMPKNIMK